MGIRLVGAPSCLSGHLGGYGLIVLAAGFAVSAAATWPLALPNAHIDTLLSPGTHREARHYLAAPATR